MASGPRSSWLGIWSRAVIVPAARKAAPVWIGATMVGSVVFGPSGMQPRDLTRLALGVPWVGAVLAVTWLLLFVPTARVIVRRDAAMYLRSLPASRWLPLAIGVAALVALQLPWLVMWIDGERGLGAAICAALTLVIAAVAAWQPRRRKRRAVRWRTDRAALRGIYLRALTRRANDAIVRCAGLAILAGLTGGLVARNNHLAAEPSAVLAIAVITVVLVPGWAGLLLPLVEAHRTSAWLAACLGIGERARSFALASTIAIIYTLAMTLAAVAACAVLQAFVLPVVALAVGVALTLAPLATRALLWADARPDQTSSRVVTSLVVSSAVAVIALGWLGALGVAALALIGIVAL